MQEKISVIIPVYNTGKMAVKLALQIVRSSYKKLEVIFVDDGSIDDSFKILSEFARQYETKTRNKAVPKIKVLVKEHSGISATRNYGIAKSTGKYISFLDSDDSIDKYFFEKLLASLKKYENLNSKELRVVMAISGILYRRAKKEKTKELYTKPLKTQLPDETFFDYIIRLFYTDGRMYFVTNKLFRADIIKHFNLSFDETMSFAEDTKFVLNYLKVAQKIGFTKLEFVLEPLYHYVYGNENSIVRTSSLSWGNWLKSYRDFMFFTEKNRTKKTKYYLKLLYLRWQISHALAVARSSQTFGHKCQHVSIFKLLPAEIIIRFRK